MPRKILLADDSVTAQNMGRKILADAGYEVVTVNNGSAALKRVHELKPDIVVLDIYMPGYSGLEVCQILKSASDTAHIPVLLSVGKLEPFKVDEARRVRADAHIVKPFEASELLKAIGQLADRVVPESETAATPTPATKARVKTETAAKTASKEVAAGKEVAASSDDTSGASHLRLSAQKTKEREKTESTAAPEGAFHDFRGVPATPNPQEATSGAQTEQMGTKQAGTEQAPDIPNDITPDELDALSALVARLETPPTSGKRVTSAFEKPATLSYEKPATPAATTSKSRPPEGVVDPVNVTQFSQKPASIDQQDEPIFAVTEYAGSHFQPKVVEGASASAGPQAEAAKADEPKMLESAGRADRFESTQSQSSRVESALVESARVESARVESAEVRASEIQATEFEVPKVDAHATVPGAESEVPAESDVQTNYATAQAAEEHVTYGEVKPRHVETDNEKSSEEELAAALRALTQAGSRAAAPLQPMEMPAVFAPAGSSTARSNDDESLVTSPRWTAEPVPVEAEEAASSLEAEMFAGIANKGAQEAPSAPEMDIEGAIVESTMVEAAKLAESVPEQQKAMAAAATADGASPALADAGTVANIVDRVLADLRPRIVEEITRKLNGK